MGGNKKEEEIMEKNVTSIQYDNMFGTFTKVKSFT